jgi:ubiquinone/menaquinone biosynthesis C-methylase UbiE
MSTSSDFSFGDNSVAASYADVLVPIIFQPWAQALAELDLAWEGSDVLDLATGTGIVARALAGKVGTGGSVTGMDMNQEMLNVASTLTTSHANLKFSLCSAESIEAPDKSFDYVVCQQGFQFFSDRNASAAEIRRVLRDGGAAVLSVWRPVSECHFFAAICTSLESIGEDAISQAMRAPFDFLPTPEFSAPFESAGFSRVTVHRERRDLVMSGGQEQAIEAAYATPIGPKLLGLPEELQVRFREALSSKVGELAGDEFTMGQMAADILLATR